MELLEQALKDQEIEESKRSLLASQENNATSQPNLKAKDAKAKDPKAKGKGAAVESDKNAPKPIEIEYAEITSEKDYILMEKSFQPKAKPV